MFWNTKCKIQLNWKPQRQWHCVHNLTLNKMTLHLVAVYALHARWNQMANWNVLTYMKPVIMQPPSYGGPHQAIDTRSTPCDMHGRPLGGSGVLSTATDAAATSQLCKFITSTVYLPLWSAWMSVNSSIDEPLPTFIWMYSLSVNSWPCANAQTNKWEMLFLKLLIDLHSLIKFSVVVVDFLVCLPTFQWNPNESHHFDIATRQQLKLYSLTAIVNFIWFQICFFVACFGLFLSISSVLFCFAVS